MYRRGFVALLPVAAAGCTGRETDGSDGTDDAGTDPEPSAPPGSATTGDPTPASPTARPPVTNATRTDGGVGGWRVPLDVGSNTPFASFVVGDPATRPSDVRPHYVVVENRADGTRRIAVRVRDRAAAGPALDTELRFPPHGVAQVRLAAPAAYEASLTVSGSTTTVPVPRSTFDCNESATGVYVSPEGNVEHSRVSQAMGCGTGTPPAAVSRRS